MKVLELCLSPDLGGLELYMSRCCEALTARGDEVIAITRPEARVNDYLARIDGLLQQRLDAPRLRALPLRRARQLAALIDEHQVDLIHMHWGKDLPLAALAKRLSKRKPALIYTRQMELTRSKRDAYHNALYDQVDQMLMITERLTRSAKANLEPRHAARARTLYYGVKAPDGEADTSRRAALRADWGVGEKSLLVGLFGRIEPYKGQHLLLEAVLGLIAEGADIHALIVGHAMDETYAEGLREQVRAAGAEGHIHFAGFTDEIQHWMQACEVVALTTREETFGLVLPEAMRAGVAVIGSNAGGVPEIIAHGRTGLLFTPGDAADLQAQLRRYLEHPAERASIAAAGRRDADTRFDERVHFDTLQQLFSDATHHHS